MSSAPPESPSEHATRLATKEARRQERREAKRLREAHRPLDAWERYRALDDQVSRGRQLVDQLDHKARFALVIIGFLNAALMIVLSRHAVAASVPAALHPFAAVLAAVYVLVTFGFFLDAIEALKPRPADWLHDVEQVRAEAKRQGEPGYEEQPLWLMNHFEIPRRDLDEYRRLWSEARLGQVNAELELIAHGTSHVIVNQYRALKRVYIELRVLTILAAVLLALAAYILFGANGAVHAAGRAPVSPSSAGAALGPVDRVGWGGVREPSGIAFHRGLGRLYLVGDEGALVELDRGGRPLGRTFVRGNLEDVAVHPASGLLLVLSEIPPAIAVFDPVSHRETARAALDTAGILGRRPGEPNQGFEGLAVRPEVGEPGGAVLYLAHQRSPPLLATVTFDPLHPPAVVGASAVLARWPLGRHDQLRAVDWAPSLDRLLLIAGPGRLLLLDRSGRVDRRVSLPGRKPEGLCLDDGGTLWIADEALGILRVPRVLQALHPMVQP